MGESIWDEQAQNGELKEAINLFIWRWGHPSLTLEQAERIAVSIFDSLTVLPEESVKITDLANSAAWKTNNGDWVVSGARE